MGSSTAPKAHPRPLSASRDTRAGTEGPWPGTIFLTFQFYRFPPVTTARLQLVSAEPGAAQLLVRLNKDGTLSTGKPCAAPGAVLQPADSGLASGLRNGAVSA